MAATRTFVLTYVTELSVKVSIVATDETVGLSATHADSRIGIEDWYHFAPADEQIPSNPIVIYDSSVNRGLARMADKLYPGVRQFDGTTKAGFFEDFYRAFLSGWYFTPTLAEETRTTVGEALVNEI